MRHQDPTGHENEADYSRHIYPLPPTNGNGFGSFKNQVLLGVVLGLGAVLGWFLTQIIADGKAITALQLKCPNQPVQRGSQLVGFDYEANPECDAK